MIVYHVKSELRGWHEVCRYPADWTGWNAFDRGMINELISSGERVVTFGWSMYALI